MDRQKIKISFNKVYSKIIAFIPKIPLWSKIISALIILLGCSNAIIVIFFGVNTIADRSVPQVYNQELAQTTTKIFQDDFENDLSNWNIFDQSTLATATVSSEQAKFGSNSLKITAVANSTAKINLEKKFPVASGSYSISVWFYDNGSLNNGFGLAVMNLSQNPPVQTILGVKPTDYNSSYYYYRTFYSAKVTPNNTYAGLPPSIKRPLTINPGWHKFEVVVTPRGTYGKIDDVNLGFLASNGDEKAVNIGMTAFDTIRLFTTWNKGASITGYFDDLTVTKIPDAPSVSSNADKMAIELASIDTYIQQYQNKKFNWLEMGYDYNNKTNPVVSQYCLSGEKAFYESAPAKGTRCEGRRVLGDSALAFAVKYRASLKNPANIDNNSLEKTKTIIGDMVAFMKSFPDDAGDNWAAPMGGGAYLFGHDALGNYSTSLAAWLIWDKLDATVQNDFKTVMAKHADKMASNAPLLNGITSYVNDTKAEENGWISEFLAVMGLMFKGDPKAAIWEEKSKQYAWHTLSSASEFNSGVQGYGGFRTANVSDVYLLSNHSFNPHPQYTCVTIGELSQGALIYKLTGSSIANIPGMYKHNVENVYIAAKDKYKLWDQKSLLWTNSFPNAGYGGKDDWYTDATICPDQFAYMSKLYPDKYTADYENFLNYHVNIRPDYLEFPPQAAFYWPKPFERWRFEQDNWFFNSVAVLKHAIAYLWLDDAITLSSVVNNSNPVPTVPASPMPTSSSEPLPTPLPSLFPSATPLPTLTPTPTPLRLFNDNFDTDLSAWTVTKSSDNKAEVTIDTPPILSPDEPATNGHALKFTNNVTNSTSGLAQISTIINPQPGTLTVYFYDDMKYSAGYAIALKNTPAQQQIIIGVNPTSMYANNYFYRTNWTWSHGINTKIVRSLGWHKIEIIIDSNGARARIDGISPPNYTSGEKTINTTLKQITEIVLFTTWGKGTGISEAYFDNLTILP